MTSEASNTIAPNTIASDTTGHLSSVDHERLSREIDALSLRQALLDFEMANARVLDLTARLVESNARVVKLQAELDGFATAAEQAQSALSEDNARLRDHATALEVLRSEAQAAAAREHAELVALRGSTTFRIVRGIGRVVKRVRR